MKGFSPLPVVLLMVGIILIYAAIKDVNPKDVIQNALQGKPTVSKSPTATIKPPPSGFSPGAGAGQGSGGGGGGSF